jgi:hypothetical protein
MRKNIAKIEATMQMLTRCLRRQIVLESRQPFSGNNSSHHQQTASTNDSKKIISEVASPKYETEVTNQNVEVDFDQFREDFDQTVLDEELPMNPVTNVERIKKTNNFRGRYTNEDKEMSKPDKFIDEDHKAAERQGSAEKVQGMKTPIMTRAELYAALSDKPQSLESRSHPIKGKFFFGSTLRLYGGSRWSELRKRAQTENIEEKAANGIEEFDSKENLEKESKRARKQKLSTCGQHDATVFDDESADFVQTVENQTPCNQISEVTGYQGNWKASEPAFIVITNSLFTNYC